METKYKVKDVVYYVNDFRVMKMVVDEVVTVEDAKGTHVGYTVSAYSKNPKAKPISVVEAYLVGSLKTAKKSARINFDKIVKQVYTDIDELTDEMYEPEKLQDINV